MALNFNPLIKEGFDEGGEKGDTGAGIIPGGTTDQVLAKNSNTDFDMKWVDQGGYTLPTASASVLGGIKVGTRLTITDGVLSADATDLSAYSTKAEADLLYAPITVTQYTDEMAQDAIGNAVGAGLAYNDTTGAISVDATLDEIGNPAGSKTFTMGGNTVTWNFTNPVGGMAFNLTGGWSGHVLEVNDTSSVPDGAEGDHLFHAETSRVNVVPAHFVNNAVGGDAMHVDGQTKLNGDTAVTGNLTATNLSGTNSGDQASSDFDIKDLTDSTSLRTTWSGKQDALGFTPENSANKGQANGYCPLGAGGKIASTYLDPIAITSTSVVASEAAQLLLTAQEGDVAVRSDESKTYIHNGGTAGTMADWTELQTPTDAVLSVDGQTGAVDLSAVYDAAGTAASAVSAHAGTNTHAQIDTFIGTTVPGTYAPLANPTFTGTLTYSATADVYAQISSGAYIVTRTADTNPALQTYISSGGVREANPKFVISISGKNSWGAGGASALDTNLYRSDADTLKTDDNFIVAGHATLEGVTSTGATGTGKFVFDTSPTLVTPNLGVATGTSLDLTGNLEVNGHRSAGSGTLSVNTVDNIAKTFTGYDISSYLQIGTTTDVTHSPSSAMTSNHYTIGGNYTVRWNSSEDGGGSAGSELRAFMGAASISGTASGNLKAATGAWGIIQHLGSGVLGTAYGVRGWIDNNAATNHTGNITTAYNFYSECSTNKNTGVIGTRYGMYIADKTGAGAVTNQYGLYIENIDGGATTNYSIYSAGGANYFGGALTLANGATLAGTGSIREQINFVNSTNAIPDFTGTLGAIVGSTSTGFVGPSGLGSGGMNIAGFTEATASLFPMVVTGYHGATSPTAPAVMLRAGKHNGATAAVALAATETVLSVRNWTTELITTLGSGATTFVGGITAPTLSLTESTSVSQLYITNTNASQTGARGAGALFIENDGAAMASGDRLGYMIFGGSSSASATRNTAGLVAYASEDWVDTTKYGTRMAIETVKNGATARTSALEFDGSQNATFAGNVSAPNLDFIGARATLSASITTTVSGAATKVALNTETYDVGADFASGTYTAPVSGYYLISGLVYFNNITAAGKYFQTMIYVNGSAVRTATLYSATGITGLSPTVSDVVYVEAGQTVELWYTHNDATTVDLFHGVGGTGLTVTLFKVA